MNFVMRTKAGNFVKLALAFAIGAGACIWNVGGLNKAAAADPEVRIVAAANEHSMAYRDGKLFVWGQNQYGQLGTGVEGTVGTPKTIDLSAVKSVKSVSTSPLFTMIVNEEGQLWEMGNNRSGQLGQSSAMVSEGYSPALNVNFEGIRVKQAAAGLDHALALTEEGKVYIWGNDTPEDLSTWTNMHIPREVAMPNGLAVKSIASGWRTSYAIATNGDLYRWGLNNTFLNSHSSDGSANWLTKPTKVGGIAKVKQVVSAQFHSAALTDDGSVYQWGVNSCTNQYIYEKTPKKVIFPNNVKLKSVAVGNKHSFAIDTEGRLYAWGSYEANGFGQCSLAPVLLTSLNNVFAIAGGYGHTVAMKADGSLWGWGYNLYREVGDGSNTTRYSPVIVDDGPPVKPTGLTLRYSSDGLTVIWNPVNTAVLYRVLWKRTDKEDYIQTVASGTTLALSKNIFDVDKNYEFRVMVADDGQSLQSEMSSPFFGIPNRS